MVTPCVEVSRALSAAAVSAVWAVTHGSHSFSQLLADFIN